MRGLKRRVRSVDGVFGNNPGDRPGADAFSKPTSRQLIGTTLLCEANSSGTQDGTISLMQVTAVTPTPPTGPWVVAMWLAFGLGGIGYGLFSREFRKGRFGEGDILTSPWRILRERVLWCAFGFFCLYIGW